MGAAEALGGLQQNVLGGAVGIGEHVGIPQTNDSPATASQKRRSQLVITRPIDVLTAVELDSQPGVSARQIDNERRNDELPGKRWPVARNAMPDGDFRWRGIVAQLTRSGSQFRIDTATHAASVSWLATLANPPPAPPLQGGEFPPLSRPSPAFSSVPPPKS